MGLSLRVRGNSKNTKKKERKRTKMGVQTEIEEAGSPNSVPNQLAMEAMNPDTPPDRLAELATDERDWLRVYVARNPHTPLDTLARLAEDRYIFVREAVAINESTPPDILARLAEDENVFVREAVASNEDTPPDRLALLAEDEDEGVRRKARTRMDTSNASKRYCTQYRTGHGSEIAFRVKQGFRLSAQGGFIVRSVEPF